LKPIILSQWKCGLKKEFFKVVGSAATVGRTDCSDHTILVKLLTFADFCFFSQCCSIWRCWLGVRKGIGPVKKTEWWDAGVVICLARGVDAYGPADSTAAHCLLLQ